MATHPNRKLDLQFQTTSSTGGAAAVLLPISSTAAVSVSRTRLLSLLGSKDDFSPGHLLTDAILKTLAQNLQFPASY